MLLNGETVINAARERVWAALNDPDTLARCIDGVERLDRIADNRFEGVLNAKVGPVKAKFSGVVELTEIDAPNRYVIVGDGKGGVAGFAKGSAEVVLQDLPDGGTSLRYEARSQVGGKLAQLGTRLVEGAAKGYAEAFFTAFKAEVEAAETPAAAAPPPPALQSEAPPAPQSDADIRAAAVAAATAVATDGSRGLPGWVWIGGLVLLAAAAVAALI